MKSHIIRFAASHKLLALVIVAIVSAIPLGIVVWLCGHEHGTFYIRRYY